MMIYLTPRFFPQFRLSYFALALFILTGQAPSAVAQTITFPNENVSDLRGLLNVFHTFKQACLKQPANRDLPVKLVPEGYQVVTLKAHLMGTESGAPAGNTAILSKTGSEQGDWDGGHLFVEFSMPSEEEPDGRCSVKWKRGWDYEDGRAGVALGMFGVLDAQVSYHLVAVLKSRPDDSFFWKRRNYGGVSDWVTRCWDGKLCNFKVLYMIDPETGIDISISRETVHR